VELYHSARQGVTTHATMSVQEGVKAAQGVACRCHRIGRVQVDLDRALTAVKVRFLRGFSWAR
jgi:hypothetical protein